MIVRACSSECGDRRHRFGAAGQRKAWRRCVKSYDGFWVTADHAELWDGIGLTSVPSRNPTPAITLGNWFSPISRRQVFEAAIMSLNTISRAAVRLWHGGNMEAAEADLTDAQLRALSGQPALFLPLTVVTTAADHPNKSSKNKDGAPYERRRAA